jgi:hypothetical protein
LSVYGLAISHAGFLKISFFELRPLHRQRTRIEPPADQEITISEQLCLNAELPEMAQLTGKRMVIGRRNSQSGSPGRGCRGGTMSPGLAKSGSSVTSHPGLCKTL